MNQWGTEWEAEDMTQKAQSELQMLSNLIDVENIKPNFVWGRIRNGLRPEIAIPKKPRNLKLPKRPEMKKIPPEPPGTEEVELSPLPQEPSIPKEPKESSDIYQVEDSFIDTIVRFTKKIKHRMKREKFENDHKMWLEQSNKITSDFEKKAKEIQEQNKKTKENAKLNHQKWKNRKENILKENSKQIKEYNFEVNKRTINYNKRLKSYKNKVRKYFEAIKDSKISTKNHFENYKYKNYESIVIYNYTLLYIINSNLPNYFPKKTNFDYNPDNALLIIEQQLPLAENIPTLKEVRYLKTKKTLKEVHHPKAHSNNLYESVLYQIPLRIIKQVFEANHSNVVSTIVFNGFVYTIDPATGQEIKPCIMSIQVDRSEIADINFSNVDPKVCFRKLKGVASAQISNIAAIPPIMTINKDDKRFVSSYDVAGSLNEGINLAAMDWEDFEHLIRELFEKEYGETGGEVKVTRASRDGGVDAIVFDPDPLRGGKIVIQAKRYTNVVGVAAVRDLYGTVLNEGANKGILVTTSSYGSDAYKFAKGKPLTLLDGGNLLHLLHRHGHKAKIDINEARSILMADKLEKRA
jgi:restriction system protein